MQLTQATQLVSGVARTGTLSPENQVVIGVQQDIKSSKRAEMSEHYAVRTGYLEIGSSSRLTMSIPEEL